MRCLQMLNVWTLCSNPADEWEQVVGDSPTFAADNPTMGKPREAPTNSNLLRIRIDTHELN
jgi:hypothetical protein